MSRGGRLLSRLGPWPFQIRPPPLVLPPIPINPHIMRRPSPGDDLLASVAVEIGGNEVFRADAAVLDDVAREGQRGRAWHGVVNENARPGGLALGILAFVAL